MADRTTQKRPNVLVLLPDQQRPDSLGCYGNGAAITPNIDRLAASGATFNNCYVQNPLCCPSRYSLATGRYPHSHGVRANWYPPRPGELSFAHQLGRVGYRTAAIGKMHFTPWHDNFGFDGRIIAEAKFHGDCPDDYAQYLRRHGYRRDQLYDAKSADYIQRLTSLTSALPQELHIDSFVGASVCEYLQRAEDPFFVFASFLSPHNPYDPPKPYDHLFDRAELPPRNMAAGEVDRKPREAYDYINTRLGWPFASDAISEGQRLDMLRSYYGLNTLIDDWVGRIVETLKERNQYDDTVIVYSSDHGDLLGDHGLFYKQCFYEQSVKVPLIVHWPARFKPRTVEKPVELMDLYATICELAGADPGPGNQSSSLIPLLDGVPERQSKDAVFSENYFGRMIRWKDYKMVYYPGKPYGELYDLAEDSREQCNLWDAMEGSPEKRALKDQLLEWAFSSEDPLPAPVRGDHFDQSPIDFELHRGHSRVKARQHWHLGGFDDLYSDWTFSVDARTRWP